MCDEAGTITIARRFRGPAGSGNGGWTAGRLATAYARLVGHGGAVEVTLRSPPPLEVELTLLPDGDALALLDGEVLVARAVGGEAPQPVDPVDLATAQAAEQEYAGLVDHPFPECFVCGPARSPGDGLRLLPGRTGDGATACAWTPQDGADGAYVWSALDCPGGWTSDIAGRPMVLGRMTAQIEATPVAGRAHVVVGRHLDTAGPKTRTACTVYDPDGRMVGRAEHLWIAVDPRTFG
ncbi:MAG: hypothetical protein M3419_10495 [Actinomycetota bacterium]|nr:hypothetical protein [Actinomycetota bacterium]